MKKLFLLSLLSLFLTGSLLTAREGQTILYTGKRELKAAHKPSTDHSKLKELQKSFSSPEEVTMACESCHTERHREIMATNHWTWSRPVVIDGKEIDLGKKNIINNFCIALTSNEPRCTSCHIGYGWKDGNFDFSNRKKVDCLVCHDRTGTYKKFPTGAGYPVTKETLFMGKKKFFPPDYTKIAQNVGIPTRDNCGTCHFFGGGGNNVKHGDLEKALSKPSKNLDIHMAVDGENMLCIDCHVTSKHNIKGKMYSVSSADTNHVYCESCHAAPVHANSVLEEHSGRVACQTCHIPTYARANPTKMWWDWSKAGRFDKNGKGIIITNSKGEQDYNFMKGEFHWEKNVTPEYVWFNGTARHTLVTDTINPQKIIQLNRLEGSYADRHAKIWPVKVMRGKQIYDVEYKTLIIPKLFGKKESGAYWKNFDWNLAAAKGMEAAGLPYSGHYGFVQTEMYWPLNHMVTSAEKALTCTECHSRNSRLAALTDFYLPGRDRNTTLDMLGMILILLAVGGSITHGLIRLITKSK
ncbi:MAG TPA: tetrathionate reductase family octaheme c-type cytochrome [Caldithrix abyssi]|uniref:Tetrathionate reductase family octaheme c-type cytochrome n=1 Tax=Caldithrix abyssi TaxID=187145 RepID=A0A7V5RQP0_CALAY|nr:tetrathionate reductase family octaheme c-type cytochrome [Caldithrix abyssi]